MLQHDVFDLIDAFSESANLSFPNLPATGQLQLEQLKLEQLQHREASTGKQAKGGQSNKLKCET